MKWLPKCLVTSLVACHCFLFLISSVTCRRKDRFWYESINDRKESESVINDIVAPYAFGYNVNDGKGGQHYHDEFGNEKGHKVGSYGYVDPNGILRRVNYVANSDGFHAEVQDKPIASLKQPVSEKSDRISAASDISAKQEIPPKIAQLPVNRAYTKMYHEPEKSPSDDSLMLYEAKSGQLQPIDWDREKKDREGQNAKQFPSYIANSKNNVFGSYYKSLRDKSHSGEDIGPRGVTNNIGAVYDKSPQKPDDDPQFKKVPKYQTFDDIHANNVNNVLTSSNSNFIKDGLTKANPEKEGLMKPYLPRAVKMVKSKKYVKYDPRNDKLLDPPAKETEVPKKIANYFASQYQQQQLNHQKFQEQQRPKNPQRPLLIPPQPANLYYVPKSSASGNQFNGRQNSGPQANLNNNYNTNPNFYFKPRPNPYFDDSEWMSNTRQKQGDANRASSASTYPSSAGRGFGFPALGSITTTSTTTPGPVSRPTPRVDSHFTWYEPVIQSNSPYIKKPSPNQGSFLATVPTDTHYATAAVPTTEKPLLIDYSLFEKRSKPIPDVHNRQNSHSHAENNDHASEKVSDKNVDFDDGKYFGHVPFGARFSGMKNKSDNLDRDSYYAKTYELTRNRPKVKKSPTNNPFNSTDDGEIIHLTFNKMTPKVHYFDNEVLFNDVSIDPKASDDLRAGDNEIDNISKRIDDADTTDTTTTNKTPTTRKRFSYESYKPPIENNDTILDKWRAREWPPPSKKSSVK